MFFASRPSLYNKDGDDTCLRLNDVKFKWYKCMASAVYLVSALNESVCNLYDIFGLSLSPRLLY